MTNKLTNYLASLRQVQLFKQISDPELEQMVEACLKSVKQYDKGQYVAVKGDSFDGIGIVLKGCISLLKTNDSDENVIIDQLREGGIFGEMIAFSKLKKWVVTVVAEQDTTIMTIDAERLFETGQVLTAGKKQLISNTLELLSNKALGINRKIEYLSIKSMRAKISKFLLSQSKQQGNKLLFEVSYSRQQMAEYLNVSRPSMCRELAKMKQEGMIDYYQKSFKILDKGKLEAKD